MAYKFLYIKSVSINAQWSNPDLFASFFNQILDIREWKFLHEENLYNWYKVIVKTIVSGVLEDLTLKISEGSDQN